ncbi:MAG: RadC family protein [Clostridia bacterium]|nr:RadC family protein [Clostridia bacterium]
MPKDTKEKKHNPHAGHRQRLKRRFLNTNGEGFEPHELFELLLFYAMPQKDTNEIAHALISRFGSVSGVLEAEVHDLVKIDGVKEHTAVLIKLLLVFLRTYFADKYNAKKVKMTPYTAGEYIVNHFFGYKEEILYAMMLDADYRMITDGIISKGTSNRTGVYPREIAQMAIETNARYVILAHNHPNGELMPSKMDIHSTEELIDIMKKLDINIIDHLIICGKKYNSIFETMNYLHFVKQQESI